ncbi:hypothetical protein O181_112798 [Austropuccinia psidii MF-1]|uniref:Uncharacterized protein n=1 Tax=Austropuccinia psidii MF-1 TaxID=1389203 RepID=A0A9Q3K154_9BASI|nr:hypothetical protein [Austropuccinia psidii MF-1]
MKIYQSQYKNWFMAGKKQEWELLPSLWIGTMNSYPQVKKFMGPKKPEDLLRGWTPISCKGQLQQIKAFLKHQIRLSGGHKKKLAQGKENIPVEDPQAFTSKNQCQKSAKKGKASPKEQSEREEKGKV